jgi:thiamine kinase-like enzyme
LIWSILKKSLISTGGGLKSWHKTEKIEDNGRTFFLKIYEKDSYEVKNELSWLLNTMISKSSNFFVPNVVESSVEKGYIKMGYLEHFEDYKNNYLEDLTNIAGEIHSILKSDRAYLRSGSYNLEDYKIFLKKYIELRFNSLNGTEFELEHTIKQKILNNLSKIKLEYFTIVHRDMRRRHLLYTKNGQKPYLIDWEFSNISHPAQDISKIIYDSIINKKEVIVDNIIHEYCILRKICYSYFLDQVNIFLPIIPLERDMSLINRKPDGYELEIKNDIYFIKKIYE